MMEQPKSGRPKGLPKATVQVSLPPELDARLRAAAKHNGRTLSEEVRRALLAHLGEEPIEAA